MNNQPLIVSYFTENSPYEKEAEDLIASCKKFGLEYQIEKIPDQGSWSKNVCFKPDFLLACLEKYNRPLIWTDIDSFFFQNPQILLDCKADVALRINDTVAADSNQKILANTMYIGNTAPSKKLLNFWKKECEKILKKDELAYDQVGLRRVILHYPTMVEIKRLPMTYFTATDTPEEKDMFPDNAVVVHYKLSRLYANQKELASV